LIEVPAPKYAILFPETEFPINKTEEVNPSLGDITVTNEILQGTDSNGPFMYFVAYNQIPPDLKKSIEGDPEAKAVSFKASLMSSATKLGGTDFKFSPVNLGTNFGMESICKVFNGNGIIKSRTFHIDEYMFMISAGGKNINEVDIDNFLNSFRIID